MADAHIKAVITAEDRASATLASVGNGFNKLMKLTAIGVAAAGAATVAFGVSAVRSFQESEDAAAQLGAVLKSTGGVAGVTADQANDLASSLQKVTKFSDETILGGENLLLTFTNIGKDVFPQATETMLNMSQALGQDVKASAVQLGKALQDPIRGVTALRRVGVNFTEKQQDVIKALVDSGKSAEAQKLILKELQVEFGGSAKAAGTTFAGKMEILKNQFDDVKESIGKTIVDALLPLGAALSTFIASDEFQAWLKQVNEWISFHIPIALKWLSEQGIPLLVATFQTMKPVLEVVIGLFVDLISFLNNNRWVLYAIVGAFIAIRTAMFLQGAYQAFLGVMTSVRVAYGITQSMIASPIAMPAIGVAAALASLWSVYNLIQAIKGALDAINEQAKSQATYESSSVQVRARLQELLKNGTPEQKARAKKALGGVSFGYAEGGFTGMGAKNEVAGVVHKGEYVIPASGVDQTTGQPKVAGGQVSVNINVGIYAGTEMEKRKMAETLLAALKDVAGSKNMSLQQLMGTM